MSGPSSAGPAPPPQFPLPPAPVAHSGFSVTQSSLSQAQTLVARRHHAEHLAQQHKSKKKKLLWFLRLEAWVDRLLSKLEVLHRKHPSIFKFGTVCMMLINEGLYVYDLYTDVIVVQFFLQNGYILAAALSILFVLWHYMTLAGLLAYFMRDFLLGLIKPDEEALIIAQAKAKAKARELGASSNWLSSTLMGINSSPFMYTVLAPFVFFTAFCISCVVVPLIDVFMLGFDAVAYFIAPKEGEDSNPLNNIFINFLLQYRTLRIPMEVIMQSLPQAILTVIMYKYIQDHPPAESGSDGSHFSIIVVIESLVASVLNIGINGIDMYLATKISGRTWLSYMVMALKFEGSAQLPPEWDERTTALNTVVDGNYHALKLAQQMKILQVALRRETIYLRTPGPLAAHPDAWSSDLHGAAISSLGQIVLENRKMIEFLYEWDKTQDLRRMPAKVEEVNDAKNNGARVDVLLHRIHLIPPTAVNDPGDDMAIGPEQLQTNMEYASTEQVCMWLISHSQMVDSLVHVKLNDCNLDASFMLHNEHSADGPIVALLRSTTLRLLDLANNPLFELKREQQPDVSPHLHGKSLYRAHHGHLHAQRTGLAAAGTSKHDDMDMSSHRARRPSQAGGGTQPSGGMLGWLRGNKGPAHRPSASGHFQRDNEYDDDERQEWTVAAAIKAFAEALKENSSVETLNLSETHMGFEAVTEIMRVLRAPWSASADDKECNITLRELDISHNHLLKELGPKRTPEEEEVYQQKIKDAAEDLASSLSTLQGLKELNMSCTFLTLDQLEVLARGLIANKTLIKVDLSDMDLCGRKDEGAKILASVVQKNHTMQNLVLRSIHLNESGTQHLADALTSNSALVALDLSHNTKNNIKIGDEGAEHLSKAFQNWRRPFEGGLQDLLLSGVDLNCSGVVKLCTGLSFMGSLRALDLSRSHLDHDLGESTITPEMRIKNSIKAAEALGLVLRANPGLSYLSLSHCYLSTRGAEALAIQLEEARFSSDTELDLEYLDLSNNPLGTDGVFRILQAVQEGYPRLVNLCLAAVNLTSDGFRDLLELFESNNSLVELDVTHNFIQNVRLEAFDRFNQRNSKLKRIDLRWNRIPDRLCGVLSEAFTLRGKGEAKVLQAQRSIREKIADFFSLEEGAEDAPYVLLV